MDDAQLGEHASKPDLEIPSALEISRGLEALIEQLRASQADQYELIRGIGHDFKSPLASATLLARALTSGQFGALTNDQAEAVETLAGSLDHLVHLADALYTAAGAYQPGASGFEVEQCNLGEIVAAVAASHRFSADVRHLALEVLPSEVTLMECDPLRLRRMVDNLISNAIKFTDVGTVTISIRRDGTNAVVTVEDTGIGIPADELYQMGDHFRRATNVGDRPGSGLGIPVVRRLANELGGSLSLTSELGVGSRAELRLPITTVSGA